MREEQKNPAPDSPPEMSRMKPMLSRHKVQVLLEAGHTKQEVARLTGMGICTVRKVPCASTAFREDIVAIKRSARSSVLQQPLPQGDEPDHLSVHLFPGIMIIRYDRPLLQSEGIHRLQQPFELTLPVLVQTV